MTGSDQNARRAYWTEQMELGYEMVEQLLTHPVEECGETFASIPAAVQDAGVEMLFSDSKIVGNLDRVFSCARATSGTSSRSARR